ncbi:uncharacterized protein CBL_11072 [Carabus blaptoides fortunei]
MEKNIINGPELEDPIEFTLGELLMLTLQMNGEKVLQVAADTGEEATGNDILKKSIRIARWLQWKGFAPGDRISIMSENRLEFTWIPCAAFLSGITIAPLNPEYTADELTHTLNLSRPKVIFCSPSCLNKIVSATGAHPFIKHVVVFGRSPPLQHSMVISLENALEARFLDSLENEEYVCPELDKKEIIATILCSSGTTGKPKGVMTTQHNMTTFIALLKQISNKSIEDEGGEVVVGLVPFFHSMGFMILFLALIGGRKLVAMRRFTVKHLLQSIQDYKINILSVPPPVVVMLCQTPLLNQYDLSSINEVRCGAAPLAREFELKICKKLKVTEVSQAYGMTETTLGVLFITPGASRLGSVGRVVPTMSAKVIDEQGNALGPNQLGELCFKGPLIMKGYINDTTATADTVDKDGWLHTGDVGYYDNDKFFYIVDRIKELIKYKAYQVPPAELEALLVTHPDILDAAVIGLPDDEAGELPLGYVVLRPGATATPRDIQEFVKGKVSSQKQLRGGVRIIELIPRNPTGKILRRVLKAMSIRAQAKL